MKLKRYMPCLVSTSYVGKPRYSGGIEQKKNGDLIKVEDLRELLEGAAPLSKPPLYIKSLMATYVRRNPYKSIDDFAMDIFNEGRKCRDKELLSLLSDKPTATSALEEKELK